MHSGAPPPRESNGNRRQAKSSSSSPQRNNQAKGGSSWWMDEWMASWLIQKRKSNLAREYANIIVRPKEHQNVYKRFCSSLSLWTKQSNSQYLTLLYDEDKQKDKRRSENHKSLEGNTTVVCLTITNQTNKRQQLQTNHPPITAPTQHPNTSYHRKTTRNEEEKKQQSEVLYKTTNQTNKPRTY